VGVRCVYFELAMSIKDNSQKCDQINITAYVGPDQDINIFFSSPPYCLYFTMRKCRYTGLVNVLSLSSLI
jgi:hypothetical protein